VGGTRTPPVSDPLRTHGDAFVRPGTLDFAVNIWPTPPSAGLRAALEGALADSAPYPDERPAREAVADRHGRPPDEVLLLNGACEAFWLIAHALRPRHAVCLHPAFTEPEAALRATGAPVTRLQQDLAGRTPVAVGDRLARGPLVGVGRTVGQRALQRGAQARGGRGGPDVDGEVQGSRPHEGIAVGAQRIAHRRGPGPAHDAATTMLAAPTARERRVARWTSAGPGGGPSPRVGRCSVCEG